MCVGPCKDSGECANLCRANNRATSMCCTDKNTFHGYCKGIPPPQCCCNLPWLP